MWKGPYNNKTLLCVDDGVRQLRRTDQYSPAGRWLFLYYIYIFLFQHLCLFHCCSLGGDIARTCRLYARLCHAFLVLKGFLLEWVTEGETTCVIGVIMIVCIFHFKADRPLMRDTLNAPWLLTDNSNGLVMVIRNYHWLSWQAES